MDSAAQRVACSMSTSCFFFWWISIQSRAQWWKSMFYTLQRKIFFPIVLNTELYCTNVWHGCVENYLEVFALLDPFRELYFSKTMTMYILIRFHNTSSTKSRFRFFLGILILRVCHQLSMSGISLNKNFLLQSVRRTVILKFAVKS